jgi:prevent-host-death family protein
MEVGVRELKQHLSQYLKRVRAGEAVVITDRGQPVARIVATPPPTLPPSVLRAIEEGRRLIYRPWRPEKLPKPMKLLPGEKTFADFVSEQRR